MSAARPHFLIEINLWARWTISSCKAKGGTAQSSNHDPDYTISALAKRYSMVTFSPTR
jgi:hypothetical protein